jgi:hypothetical protein
MRTSDEYDPLVRPYRGLVVITLNVLSFLLLVKCKQPIYHRNSFFMPFQHDGMDCLDSKQSATAVGNALLQMNANLNLAWEEIKDNSLFGNKNKESPYFLPIESIVSHFQEEWRRLDESADADEEQTINSVGSDLDPGSTGTGSRGSNESRVSKGSPSTEGGTATGRSIVPSTAPASSGLVSRAGGPTVEEVTVDGR